MSYQPQPQYQSQQRYQHQQQASVLHGPGVRDYVVRLAGFGESTPSPRESAALDQAGVTESRVRSLLVWRRTLLIVITPLLLLAFILNLYNTVLRMNSDIAEYLTGVGYLQLWLPTVTLLAFPVSAVIAIGWWTESRRSTRILLWSWGVATVTPLLVALVPMSWVYDFQGLGASDFEYFNGYEADPSQDADAVADLADSNALGYGMLSTLSYAVGLLPVIVGLVSGVLRGARRTKGMFPSSIVPGWFVVIAAPFYAAILLTMFAVIAPVLGNGLLAVGVLVLALAPLANLLFMKTFTRPMARSVAEPVFFRSSVVSLAVGAVGGLLILVFLLTGEVHGTRILGSTTEGEDAAWFSYLDIIQAAIGLIARYYFTTLVMSFLFARLVFRESREIVSMEPQVRAELVEDMEGLRRFAGGVDGSGRFPVPPTQQSTYLSGRW